MYDLNYLNLIFPEGNSFNIYGSPINSYIPFPNDKRDIIINAAKRWEEIIITGPISYITIYVYLSSQLDSDVGAVTSSWVGTINYTKDHILGNIIPFANTVEFNSKKINYLYSHKKSNNKSSLYYVALHEFGHCLGIGSAWEDVYRYGISSSIFEIINQKYYYKGQYANIEYRKLLGVDITNTNYKIPIEDDPFSGTERLHPEEGFIWEKEIRYKDGHKHFGLDHELMTGYIESDPRPEPLSAISIGFLKDLGFSTRDKSDPYSLFIISFNESGNLKIKGALENSTGGGSSTNEERLLYYYKDKTVPYLGNERPYVILPQHHEYYLLKDFNNIIAFNSENHLMVDGFLAYQFINDISENDQNGINTDWKLFEKNITPTIYIPPTISPETPIIEENEEDYIVAAATTENAWLNSEERGPKIDDLKNQLKGNAGNIPNISGSFTGKGFFNDDHEITNGGEGGVNEVQKDRRRRENAIKYFPIHLKLIARMSMEKINSNYLKTIWDCHLISI